VVGPPSDSRPGPARGRTLLNQTDVVAHYLKLAVWPRALVLDYGVPQPLMWQDVIAPASLLIVLLVAVIAALVYLPELGFLGACFFIILAPTSSIVPIASEVGAERRMYLPLAGLVVLAVAALYLLVWRSSARNARQSVDGRGRGGRVGCHRRHDRTHARVCIAAGAVANDRGASAHGSRALPARQRVDRGTSRTGRRSPNSARLRRSIRRRISRSASSWRTSSASTTPSWS
jgi:hypothetical protein